MTSGDAFWSIGWLSVDEIHQGATNLHIDVSTYMSVTEFLQSSSKYSILLYDHHYYLQINTTTKRYLFDSAGPSHCQLHLLQYLMYDTYGNVVINCHRYQPVGSTLCGQYCLFVAWLHARVNPTNLYKTLNTYLVTNDISLTANDFMITYFTMRYRLGEEFNDTKETAYDICRRFVNLCDKFD